MAGTNTISRVSANQAVEDITGKGSMLPLVRRILEAAQRIWPRRTESVMADHAGVSKRAVRFWFAKQTGMSLPAAAALLHTEEGFEILDAIMGEHQPRWFKIAKIALEQDNVARQIRVMERRLDKARQIRSQIEMEV